MKTAERLFKLGNEISSSINIHADNDFAFKWACENGVNYIKKN
jgi:hypothetical protein